MKKTESIIIRVSIKTKKDITEIAKKERRTLSNYLRIILEENILINNNKSK